MNKNKGIFVYCDISKWGGSTKATAADSKAGIVEGELPPESLVTRGSKWLVNRLSLQVFDSIRKRAERLLKEKAVNVHGVWLVAEDAFSEVAVELDKLRDEYAQEALNYVDAIHGAWSTWREANGSWGELIVSELPDREKLLAAFDFKWGRLLDDDTLSDSLYTEIEASSNKLRGNVWGKPAFSRSSLVHIRNMRDKLDSMAALDPRVPPVVELIDRTLDSLPTEGPIPVAPILGLLSLLSDTESLRDYGAKSIAETTSTPKVFGIVPPLPLPKLALARAA